MKVQMTRKSLGMKKTNLKSWMFANCEVIDA